MDQMESIAQRSRQKTDARNVQEEAILKALQSGVSNVRVYKLGLVIVCRDGTFIEAGLAAFPEDGGEFRVELQK